MLTKFAVKDFISDRELRNLSPTTIKSYQYTLNEFYDFCVKQESLNIEDINVTSVKEYLNYCKKTRKNGASSINHKLHNLRVFFNYVEESGYIPKDTNPAKKVSYAKTDVEIDVFTDAQIQQMLKYFAKLKYKDKTFYSYRDYSIIVTLLGTGMRLGELCNLKWQHIDFENQALVVYGKKRSGSSIPVFDKLKKELLEYNGYCNTIYREIPDYVFTNRDGQQLTPNAVKCIFKRLKEVMNFRNVRLSAHTFRHTFAYRYLMAGGDVFSLQKMLRHSELSMTERYVNMTGVGLQTQNTKFNPLNNIDI